MGRIIGDTAIVIVLLGATLQDTNRSARVPVIGLLRGTGSTLTSYVYNNSPAGEGNAHEKAYAAAFVLLMIVLALNALVTRDQRAPANRSRRAPTRGSATIGRSVSMDPLMPPPVRRIARRPRAARRAAARRRANGGTRSPPRPPPPAARPARPPVAQRARADAHRIGVARLRRELGRARRQPARAPGRGARADRRLGLGQDDAAALAQPPHRDHRRRGARRADHARRRATSTSSRSTSCAAASRWSSSSRTRSR